MAPNSYFVDYVDILSDSFKKIRKIGFKKFNLIKQLIDTLQSFLAKQVYGRIEPSNYLLLLILVLGSKNSKLYPIVIQAVQKLFSHNFISPNESITNSLKLLKEQHKQLLLLPIEDYSNKIFKEVYIQTLSCLPQRDDNLNLSIVKNYTLIWRLSQSSLSIGTIQVIFNFIIQAIMNNKLEENDKVFKSAFLQIVRHSFESYKQCSDYKFITDENNISVKSLCHNYGRIIADTVSIQMAVENTHKVEKYEIIPSNPSQFQLLTIQEVNEHGVKSGKFGWCIMCRKPALYYCRANKVPVCSFQCKNKSFHEFQMVDKLVNEEFRSSKVYQNHIKRICRMFVKYLNHPDPKKTSCFAQIFVYVASEFKKLNLEQICQNTLKQIRWIFRQVIYNVQVESEAFLGSLISLKKMLQLKMFVQQTEIVLMVFAKKLTHFLTPTNIKEQILKVCKELINSNLLLDYTLTYDCSQKKMDAVKDLVSAIAQLYIGVPPPEGIVLPPQDANVRKASYQIMTLLFKTIQKSKKKLGFEQETIIFQLKQGKNLLKNNINKFNKAEKPFKIIKQLISEGFLQKNAQKIAQFLHKNIGELSLVNIGVLIGGYDPFEMEIRDEFFIQIKFQNLMIDEGIRKLLKHFTIPGQSQVVQRIIDSFSKIFFQQNRQDDIFHHSDAVYSFSYLLMMLQTNLHNPQVLEKMTLKQFANLSKGMNGQRDFNQQFLGKIYKSIQKSQLGFHQKMKQIEILNAYKENPKKAQQLHIKELQRQIRQSYEDLTQITYEQIPHMQYPIKIFVNQFVEHIQDAMMVKLHQLQDKPQILIILDQLQNIMKFSMKEGVPKNIQKGIGSIWDQITKLNTSKKYFLLQKLLEWVKLFDQYLQDKWSIIIYMFSKFYRNKLIKKQYHPGSKKDDLAVIIGDKCYIYEPFLNSLWAKSSKYTLSNFKCLIVALIQVNKQQINQGSHPFCLQKIGQIQDQNMNRAIDIFPMLWPILKEYYVELGKNKNQKTALFGTDFLKQLITKFLKKKDLINYQKDYMKPLQQIFTATNIFAVKQYIIGSLTYFINNHFTNMKSGWKIILPIICETFDEDQDPIIKEKAFLNVKKIYQSNFTVMNLQENYVDFVQILTRLSHQKEQIYPKGCLDAAKSIIQYYHKKHNINLENLQDQANASLDVTFWQTYYLPLLSTIYIICGDSRSDVQISAIQLLFSVLMKYGKLFKYQFWKMVLQGVLRPTFEQITYTSQSKPLKKQQLQNWLRSSFQLLFSSINQLICEYFHDFRLFLFDVLKIYETCILSYSNKILIQLSIFALGDLFQKVGNKFQTSEWQQFLRFLQNILKKILPKQIFSIQNWKKHKEMPENSYQGKSIALNLFLGKIQQIVDKYSNTFGQNILREILINLTAVYERVSEFNHNIQLRKQLWADGYYQNLKSLPGLVKQQHETLKAIAICKWRLVQYSQVNLRHYLQFILQNCLIYKESMILVHPKQSSVALDQRYRQFLMIQILLHDTIFKQLKQSGSFEQIIMKIKSVDYTERIFQALLQILNRRSFCSNCKTCEYCEMNLDRERQFNEQTKEFIKEIFKRKQ